MSDENNTSGNGVESHSQGNGAQNGTQNNTPPYSMPSYPQNSYGHGQMNNPQPRYGQPTQQVYGQNPYTPYNYGQSGQTGQTPRPQAPYGYGQQQSYNPHPYGQSTNPTTPAYPPVPPASYGGAPYYAQGYPQNSYPQGPYPQKTVTAKRHNGGGIIALISGIVVVLILFSVVAQAMRVGSDTTTDAGNGTRRSASPTYASSRPSASASAQPSTTAAPTSTPPSTPTPTVVTYEYGQAASYQSYIDRINTLYTYYTTHDSATIASYLGENGSASTVDTWVRAITNIKNASETGDHRHATDLADAQALYEQKLAELEELHEDFLLSLGYSYRAVTTSENGYKYFDITVTSTPARSSMPSSADLDAREAQAVAFQPTLGQDGTYMDSARSLIGIFGLHVSTDISASTCGGVTATTFAFFCNAQPDTIYWNTTISNFNQSFTQPIIISVMKHELAHYVIYARCRTPKPTVASSSESLANSYAALYLGADAAGLRQWVEGNPEYYATAESDQAAQQVHAGTCAVKPV